MDPTRNPAEDTDFDIDAWERWQQLRAAWRTVSSARRKAARAGAMPAPDQLQPEPEAPCGICLLPVPN